MIDEAKLFAAIKGIANKPLQQIQVDSVHAILAACAKYHITDTRQIAYVLATAYHESRLKPIEEIGRGAGKEYGKPINGHVYYGRSFCQLTWLSNYKTFAAILKVDLVNRPELALNVDYAADIIALGMKNSMFTGVGLDKYFTPVKTDPFNARRIINSLDCAALIQGYYNHIYEALK